MPGDEHGHDDRLARAGCHLHRDAIETGVRSLVGVAEPVLNPVVADLPGGFGEVDECFEGLDLAEEELVLPVGVDPVLQELASALGHPLIFPFSPVLDLLSNEVGLVVRLDAVLRPFGLELELLAFLLRCRNRDEVSARSSCLDDFVQDPFVAEPPMPVRFPVGRVQDRVFDERVRHTSLPRRR